MEEAAELGADCCVDRDELGGDLAGAWRSSSLLGGEAMAKLGEKGGRSGRTTRKRGFLGGGEKGERRERHGWEPVSLNLRAGDE